MEENRANKTPESMAPLFNIVGEKVALGPLRKDLVPYCNRWYNDLRTMSRLGDTDVPWTL